MTASGLHVTADAMSVGLERMELIIVLIVTMIQIHELMIGKDNPIKDAFHKERIQMGVDASYLYGYGAEVSSIEWDLEYLEEKYKDKLDEHVNTQYSWSSTWREFIENMKTAIEDEDEYGTVGEQLEDISHLCNINYDDESYLTFDHTHIAKLFPEAKLKDLEETAKLYAKELGIKNIEDIEWIEWGYFS